MDADTGHTVGAGQSYVWDGAIDATRVAVP